MRSVCSVRCLVRPWRTVASLAIRVMGCAFLSVSIPTAATSAMAKSSLSRLRSNGKARSSDASRTPAYGGARWLRFGSRTSTCSPPCERVAFRHGVRWAGLEHPEDMGTAVGAIPCRALRRIGCADGR